MKQTRQDREVALEPRGIVIADRAPVEVTPRFVAFVWGPPPEPVAVEVSSEPRAA